DSIRRIIESLDAVTTEVTESSPASDAPSNPQPSAAPGTTADGVKTITPKALVLACPAHHMAEELSLEMFARLLRSDGVDVDIVSTRALPGDVQARVQRE